MGVFDDIQAGLGKGFDAAMDAAGKGFDAAASATNKALVTRAPFIQAFIHLCDDGWLQGWHERNGGNLTYRMTEEDVAKARGGFDSEPRAWVDLGFSEPTLANAYFLITGSGAYMHNVSASPIENIGIVEMNEAGSAYRVVWGLVNRKPTSELPTHIMNHAIRMKTTDGACRVIYHAHPNNIIAMTFVEPLDARTFSRALWKAMTECVVVFPEGVGVVPWMVPGGNEIAKATSEQMKSYPAVIWAQHGLFVSGADFDETFGLMHCIEKAADIYFRARTMNGGSNEFLNTITDEGLAQIGVEFNVEINKEFLDVQ